jgi:hypothetical protein
MHPIQAGSCFEVSPDAGFRREKPGILRLLTGVPLANRPQFQHKTTRPETLAAASVGGGGDGLAIEYLLYLRSDVQRHAIGGRWPDRGGTLHG